MRNFIDDTILNFYAKFTLQMKTAFVVAIVIGLFSHMFFFTNKLPNHDDLFYGFDMHLDSPINNLFNQGKWAFPFFCEISGGWSVPWLIGVLSIVLIAVSAMIIVQVIEIRSNVIAALIAGLMETFPALTSTLLYMHAASAFCFGIMFSCLAVFFTTSKIPSLIGILSSALCIALSLGCYQAYLPFFCGLICISLFKRSLLGESLSTGMICIRRALLAISIGVAIYFFMMKLFIVTKSRFAYSEIIFPFFPRLYDGTWALIDFFWGNLYGIASNNTKIVCSLLAVISLSLIIYIFYLKRRTAFECFYSILLLAVLFFSIILIYFLKDKNTFVHLIMMYPFVLLPVSFLVIIDYSIGYSTGSKNGLMIKKLIVGIVTLSFSVLCWRYIVYSNKSYLQMQLMHSQVYSFSTRLIERIECLPSYKNDIPIVFIGAPSIEKYNISFSQSIWRRDRPAQGVLTPDGMLGSAATAYNCFEVYLQQLHGWKHKIYREYAHFGGKLKDIDIEKIKNQLEVYPANGSMRIINNMIYVRFQ